MKNIVGGYKGYIVVNENDARLPAFYTDFRINHFGLLENEYVIIERNDGTVADIRKWQGGTHRPVSEFCLKSAELGDIRPKNIEQRIAIDILLDDSITVKTLTGGFGSGKTFLSCGAAFQMINEERYDKIVWVRNNIEVKNTNPIGALPGDQTDKLSVWAMPLADHLGGVEALNLMITQGKIEVQHLGFIRGRDIKKSIIFVSEAEHLTRDHDKLLLGRVSEGSIIIFEGDCRQIDSKAFEGDNGLQALISCLKGNPLYGYVHLTESVRSDTAKLADLLDVEDN